MAAVSAPRVGPPADDHRAVCEFSATRGAPKCGAAATVHVCTTSPEWGTVALATCDEHVDIARRAGHQEAEHPHRGLCGIAGTLWTDEQCVLDDSGVEPELVGARELEQVQ